jgi:hypothetical protein
MKSDYTLTRLSSQLIYIQWYRTAGTTSGIQLVQDIQKILAEATEVQYFISDLRRGRIIDIPIISRLSELTKHKLWGGSSAFSVNPISKIFAGSFIKYARKGDERDTLYDLPQDAIDFLESLQTGLTTEIDWASLIQA